MKEKVLIIFKYPHGHWNIPIVDKFSNFFETESLYINEHKDKNFTEIINYINDFIKKKSISYIVFDVDYFKFINFFFINEIKCKKKILISGDDFELHEMNSITASSCDLVLTACPLSVLKYREKGYEANLIHFESGKINNNDATKEIDVLFFGSLTDDRRDILNYISHNGVNLRNMGHDEKKLGVPEKELLNLISKSKIVLNLSKTRTTSIKNFSSENIYNFYYQFKGRIIMAGLNNSICVSEYSPGQELLFKDDEVPTFFTKEECVKIIKELLSDKDKLTNVKNKFLSKVESICEERKSFEMVSNSMKKSGHRRVKLIKFPYWYLRIAAKHVLLRNIKITNILKTVFQFKIIYKMISHSNILVKFLIIFESIINSIWYSLVKTLKK